APSAIVMTQVIAVDRIAIALQPIMEANVPRQIVGAADSGLKPLHGMAVCEHLGPVPEQHKQIRVPPVSKGSVRLLAQFLANCREPSLGAFPGIVVPVK